MFGISVFFNNKTTIKENIEYIDLAHKYGYKRIWLGLEIGADYNLDDVIAVLKHAEELGFMNCIDVYPDFFKHYNISIDDLTFFKDIHIHCLRVDYGFTGKEEALMSYNKLGLKIEFNSSSLNNYIDNIFSFKPNPLNVMSCHNFYPQVYSGMAENIYLQCNDKVKKYNLHNAAFVTSQLGLVPTKTGLPTLEDHRNLPIEIQAKHLVALKNIDDIIIGNAFASEDEINKLSNIKIDILTLKVEKLLDDDFTNQVLYHETHFRRLDASEYLIRSCEGRIKWKDTTIAPQNTFETIEKGSIVIFNDNDSDYKGELQIILKPIKNDGSRNVIGKIVDEELLLIDYITPGDHFEFE